MSKEMLIFLSSGRYETLNKNHYCGNDFFFWVLEDMKHWIKIITVVSWRRRLFWQFTNRNDHTSQKSSPIYMPSLLRKHTIHWISEIKKCVWISFDILKGLQCHKLPTLLILNFSSYFMSFNSTRWDNIQKFGKETFFQNGINKFYVIK